MMPEADKNANKAVIAQHLTHLTRRWGELDRACVFEVRFLSADDSAQVKNVARFSADAPGIDMAADHIAGMNQHKLNAYVVVNPINAAAQIDRNRGAKDTDIVASFYQFADADDEEAAHNIKEYVGPKGTWYVLTGTQPCYRPHVYWELEEPTYNLPAWTQTQKAIAATLKTDRSVVNPSRIMRIAGTVNWPKPKKQAKGYVAEVTDLHIYSEDERPRVTSERMARAFAAAPEATDAPRIATNVYDGPSVDTYGDMLQRARTDGEKHTGVRDLAASLAGQGVKLEMAEAIIREACPVWDENVEGLISSAYQKFTPRDEQFSELSEEEKEAIPAALFDWWQPMDLAAIPAPEFLYSDFYARGYTSLTVAAPKVGKSMLGLAEAIDAATGRGFLTGVQREPLRVVYYNAEDDQNAVNARVAALLTEYGIDQSEIAGRLAPVSGVNRDDFYMVSGLEGVINEALFVSLEKFCAEQRADLLIFDPLQDLSHSPETNEIFRMLGQRLRRMASTCGVALGLVHHTRKVAAGTAPSIDDARGGSAIRGTARFNRILVTMTEEEATKAGIENHRFYLRIGDMESNLAPPSADVNRWFEKTSVQVPNGQYIGAIRPWKWPDAFDGITKQEARRVQLAVAEMQDEPPLESNRSPQRWVGVVVADTLGLDLGDAASRARVNLLVKGWIKTGVLKVAEYRDTRAGRDRRAVYCGPNNPLSQENAT